MTAKPYHVYITRKIPQPAIDLLEEYCTVTYNEIEDALTPEQLKNAVKDKDAILSMFYDKFTPEVLDCCNKAKIVANFAVGFENLDIPAATERGIYLSNTPGVLNIATAETAWALIFAVARNIPAMDAVCRTGKMDSWSPFGYLGQEITGKTLGVIGAGRIGSAMIHMAKGFHMPVLYSAHSPKPELEQETGAIFTDLDTLLKKSDIISIHAPATPETKYLISKTQFEMMKTTAILINTARGQLINTQDLIWALENKVIAGAGIDVFENEPYVTPGLEKLSNLVMTPHIGSATYETRVNMGLTAARNIIAALKGELPPNCLNPDAKQK